MWRIQKTSVYHQIELRSLPLARLPATINFGRWHVLTFPLQRHGPHFSAAPKMDDQSGGYGMGTGGMVGGWVQQGCIPHGTPVVGAAFDSEEERLHVTDSAGFLASYTLPDAQLYTSTRTCWVSTYDDPAWSITNLQGHGLRPTVAAR